MKRWLLAVLVGAALLGCGGESPIGRARDKQSGVVRVTGIDSTGKRQTVVSNSGRAFEMGPFAPGPAVFEFESNDRAFLRETVQAAMGSEQRFVLNARLWTRDDTANVTDLTVALLDGQTVPVGAAIELRPTVVGPAAAHGDVPTVWVSGGVGTLDEGDVFRATVPGSGEIRLKLYGFEKAYRIQVE
jgi:hypothetical protein